MEQIPLHKNLSKEEKKNVYLAVACGALQVVHDIIPGPEHQKRKRILRQLRADILRYGSARIPKVAPHNMQLLKDTIIASEQGLAKILEEGNNNVFHILLNLAGFCMEQLPLQPDHFKRYNEFFTIWSDAYHYQDVRCGERVFNRLDSEIEILVAQRGGILL